MWSWEVKLKTHLHYNIAYAKQTYQGNDLLGGTPTNIGILPFNHMELQDHVTNQKCYISTNKIHEATKLNRIMI